MTRIFLTVGLLCHFFPFSSGLKYSETPVCKPEKCDCEKVGLVNCDDQLLTTVAVDPLVGAHTVTIFSMISNRITQIKQNEILGGRGDRLNRLFLSNNLIEEIEDGAFNCTPQLEYLDLSNNIITNLSHQTFSGISNLITLFLNHNTIQDLSNSGLLFADLPQLRYLSIDWNPVKYLSNETFVGLESLIELSMDHGELSNLPTNSFKSLSRLETLSLRHNRFHVLPMEELRWLSQLKHLDFSGNPILTINSNAFRHNTYLRTLSFINMPQLSYVEDCAFCNLYELRTLQIINASKFTDFDPEAFGRDNIYFGALETIDLVNNSLAALDENMLAWENVTGVIRLHGNPWKCDCNALWMMNKASKYDKAKPPVCDSPARLRGKSIVDLRQYDPGFCVFTRLNSKIHTARLFMLAAGLIMLFVVFSTVCYFFANRHRNGFKFRNLFHKPQLPKYAYRNLAMGDDIEYDYDTGGTNDAGSILPKKKEKADRDLASRLAEDV